VTTPSVSESVVVDSSGWLEYITADSKAAEFARYLEGENSILVPTIVVYEVYKKLLTAEGKTAADRFVSQALRRRIIPFDENLALAAANVGLEYRLAMADAIIYATALASRAQLITSDPHFRGLPGVTLL
jgi:predicted nucleic acid-binding protein